MIQIYEYVMENYTLFLGGAILILLAIIGYYADKTNFGQGKKNEKEENLNNINQVGISDITNNANEIVTQDNVTSIQPQTSLVDEESQKNVILEISSLNEQLNLEESIEKSNELNNLEGVDNSENSVVVAEDNVVNEINNMVVLPEKNIQPDIDEISVAEAEFNKFNDEFNSLLPKKEIISTDLLSDIEELGIDRKQKINLSDVPDLDDISLPKIKNLVSDQQDIWKF